MILVHLAKSWPRVLPGEAEADEVTLRWWAAIKDLDLYRYADAVLGIYRNEVVTAYDVLGWERVSTDGCPSVACPRRVGAPGRRAESRQAVDQGPRAPGAVRVQREAAAGRGVGA